VQQQKREVIHCCLLRHHHCFLNASYYYSTTTRRSKLEADVADGTVTYLASCEYERFLKNIEYLLLGTKVCDVATPLFHFSRGEQEAFMERSVKMAGMTDCITFRVDE
jgi:hypothetical protein